MGKFRFAVIGMGPSGATLAAHLAAGGEDVSIVEMLDEHVKAISQHGLRLTGIEDRSVEIQHAYNSISNLEGEGIDVLFIATKTFSLPAVLEEIGEIYREEMKIVCFQNGIDNEDLVADRFGQAAALRVVINYAGILVQPGEIEVTFFHKPNYIGAVSDDSLDTAKDLAGILTDAGLETEFTSDIKVHEWRKTILNAALSPVTAVTGLTMKQAMELPETRWLVESLLREAIVVARARGVELEKDYFEQGIRYLSAAGDHKPSMLVDIEEGGQTEIDFITGKIVQHAEQCNTACPVNSTLYSLVRGLEARR